MSDSDVPAHHNSSDESDKIDEYAVLAHSLVDAAIENALSVLCFDCTEDNMAKYRKRNLISNETDEQEQEEEEEEEFELSTTVPNIQWMTIDEFTPQLGEDKIDEFIKTWFYEEAWLYCIDLISTDELDFDFRYRYRVRWSIPTRRQPIPRATASIYFTIEVSKIKPKDFPVNVYYVIESNRLVHRPGQIRFEEKWLKDVIENKVQLLRGIEF